MRRSERKQKWVSHLLFVRGSPAEADNPRRLCGLVLVCALALSFAGSARASDPDEQRRQEARVQYELGARFYEQGQFLDAVRAFERAYGLSGAKPLLFNIAQAYRLVGPAHCERALDAYVSYLEADPKASNRAEVEERITSMRVCLETQRKQGQPLPAVSPDSSKAALPASTSVRNTRMDVGADARPSRVLPLTLIVGGSLVALGGAALYALARSEYEHAESTCPCPEGKYARWERITRVSYGLAAAGGTTLASGLVWLGALRKNRYSLGVAPWRIRFTGRF